MQLLTPRSTVAVAFAMAALSCQILVWLCVDIDHDLPVWRVFWLQCTVVPVAGLLGALIWPPQSLTQREGVWRGWAVMFVFMCASAGLLATVLGDYSNVAEWTSALVTSFALMFRVLGAALLFAFGVTGYFLADDAPVATQAPTQVESAHLAQWSANDSDFGLHAVVRSPEDRVDV